MKPEVADDPRGGFALILVLWTLLLVAVLTQSLMLEARTSKATAVDEVARFQDRLLLDGAINRAIAASLDQRDPLRLALDGTRHVTQVLGRDVELSEQNEAGKINPNLAAPALISKLLRYLGAPEPEALTLEIVAWRDPSPTAMQQGSIDRYRAAGRRYLPRFGPFRCGGELGLVLGMSDTLLQAAQPFLTVWSSDGAIDRTLASDGMLQMLAATGDPLASSQKNALDAGQAAGADRTVALGDVVTITARLNTPASKRSQSATIQFIGGRRMSYRTLSFQ